MYTNMRLSLDVENKCLQATTHTLVYTGLIWAKALQIILKKKLIILALKSNDFGKTKSIKTHYDVVET